MRWLSLVLALSAIVPAHGASLRDTPVTRVARWFVVRDLARRIEPYDPLWFEEPVPPDMPEVMAQVARAINEDITDEGFTVDGKQLVNILSVQPEYAKKLQGDPLVVRTQLQASVCANQRFRRLMDLGATLAYHFVLTDSSQPVLTQRFIAEHCQSL